MRIAVLGSGGIGGYYGARLAQGGHDVVFVARGAHLEAMQRNGLTIRTPSGGSATVPVIAVENTRGVHAVELVLFCVKSYDTEPAARLLEPLMSPQTAVLTLQNGLDNAAALAAVIGREAVLAGAVYVALQLEGPGVIRHGGGDGKIVFGERGGAVTDRVRRIVAALEDGHVPHAVSPDIERVLWEKFLFITGIGAVTALARSGVGPLVASAEGHGLLTASCAEVAAVARAEGHALQPDAMVAQAAALPPEWRSSMARDLEDGRRLEVDALSGSVVRRGRRHDIPTPVHQTILACLSLPHGRTS
ncbi:MAG TPA: 2-dehydropantoate 2-reductase [Methylomirabilota bacterium]|nr:2-dehydropantoate 2-reductase [Methylomirabilota bacterium]